jgi:hypothetical protein
VLVVEHGQEAKAEHAISRLQSPNTGVDIPTPGQSVALLSQTNAAEKRLTAGAGYSECFKGTNLRRTEITVGTWVTQQMCGPVLQVCHRTRTGLNSDIRYLFLPAGWSTSCSGFQHDSRPRESHTQRWLLISSTLLLSLALSSLGP